MPTGPGRPTTVFTVGHGTRPADALVAVLRGAGVMTLVDIRRYPTSRHHPQFTRASLAATLATAGIGYEWQGEDLGGRRSRSPRSRHTALRDPGFAGFADHMDSPVFRSAVGALLARAAPDSPAPERLAIMCAETLWWRCHRMLVADALTLRGARVVHLLDVGKRQEHRYSLTMRPDPEGWPVYDVPDTLPGLG